MHARFAILFKILNRWYYILPLKGEVAKLKMKSLLCITLLMIMAFSFTTVFAANTVTGTYDITGNWIIECKTTAGLWDHKYVITQTGSNFIANANYPANDNPTIAEDITGTIDVNTGALTWHVVYYYTENSTKTGYTFDATATIDSSGKISGTFTGNNGVSGTIYSISGQATVTQPQPTTTETFEVQMQVGTVEVKLAGSSDWVPTQIGMVLHVGDSVRAVGNQYDNVVKLHHTADAISSSDKQVLIRGGCTVELKSYQSEHPTGYRSDLLEWAVIKGVGFMRSASPGLQPTLPDFEVKTPHARITEVHTMFEVIVSDAGTTVNVIEGTVQVSDLNGNNTVNVNANQTTTVLAGGVPTTPTSFDPATVDDWWTTILTSPSGSSDSLNSILPFLVGIITIIVVAVTLGVLITKRRRKQIAPHPTAGTPPPPPPPP